jgi:hypothetical protein
LVAGGRNARVAGARGVADEYNADFEAYMSRFGLDPPTVPPGCTFVGTTPPQASSTGPATYWVVQATTKYVDAGMTSSSCRWDFASLSDTAYLTRCEWAFVDQVGRNDGCPQASRNACEATAVANNCCVENLDPAVAQANDCDGSACRADCVPHPFISSWDCSAADPRCEAVPTYPSCLETMPSRHVSRCCCKTAPDAVFCSERP